MCFQGNIKRKFGGNRRRISMTRSSARWQDHVEGARWQCREEVGMRVVLISKEVQEEVRETLQCRVEMAWCRERRGETMCKHTYDDCQPRAAEQVKWQHSSAGAQKKQEQNEAEAEGRQDDGGQLYIRCVRTAPQVAVENLNRQEHKA